MTIGRMLMALTLGACIGTVTTGCGTSPEGTTVNVGVTQTQTNDQNQVVNEGEANCSLNCTLGANGLASGTKECDGAATVVVAVTNLDECDSVSEAAQAQATVAAEAQG